MKKAQSLGDGPIESEYAAKMTAIVQALDELFNGQVGGKGRQTGFVLLVFPFGEKKGAATMCPTAPTAMTSSRCSRSRSSASRGSRGRVGEGLMADLQFVDTVTPPARNVANAATQWTVRAALIPPPRLATFRSASGAHA